MSKKLRGLLDELSPMVARQNLLMAIRNGKAEGEEKRELTEDENAEFDLLEESIIQKKAEITREEKFAQAAQRNAEQHFVNVQSEKKSEEAKASSSYSLIRAFNHLQKGKPLDGVEAEVQQQAEKEAKERGVSLSGIGLPSFMMKIAERAQTVGTATNAGNTVATDLGDIIPALRPRLKTRELGATILDGLVGNLDLPVGNALASASWATETGNASSTDPTVNKISLTPNRLAGYTDVSKQLLNQSSISVEQWIRAELSDAIARAVDLAGINGTGSSNQPTGILNTAGIGSVAIGTNGGLPTFAHMVDLETEIAKDNADVMNMSYLTTPGIKGLLKQTEVASNTGLFVWGQDVNGYNATVSTQVPSALTKGTSTDCHAVIFGNWADLIIANWGMVDITVDPYTQAVAGQVRMVVNSYWDIAVKHAESFAAIKDARVSL